MPKVTVEGASGKRSYEGVYAYGAVVKMDKNGSVASQAYGEPANWEKGMGLFLVAISALRSIAETEGDEQFKVASRVALNAISKMEPQEAE